MHACRSTLEDPTGEAPECVFNVGALAVDNVRSTELMDPAEFAEKLGVTCDDSTLLVTYHPLTRGGDWRPELDSFLAALDELVEHRVLITAPNADAGGQGVAGALAAWVDANSERAAMVKSLGRRGYLSAVKLCAAVVGNSSSGLIEVPALGVPSVDVGARQAGRLRPESVTHCDAQTDAIVAAVRHAASPEHRAFAAGAPNPYGDGHTAQRIAEHLADSALIAHSRTAGFVDLACAGIEPEAT